MSRRRRLAAVASTALLALATAGCLQSRIDPAPTLENSTDEAIFAAFWRGSPIDPAFIFIGANRELDMTIARNDETGCLTDGGWHTMEIYEARPEWDPNFDPRPGELDADPAYTRDLEQDPLCGGETWTWDGERLLRTD